MCLPLELLVLLLQGPDPSSGVILFLLLLVVLARSGGGVGACLVWPTGTRLAYIHDRQIEETQVPLQCHAAKARL